MYGGVQPLFHAERRNLPDGLISGVGVGLGRRCETNLVSNTWPSSQQRLAQRVSVRRARRYQCLRGRLIKSPDGACVHRAHKTADPVWLPPPTDSSPEQRVVLGQRWSAPGTGWRCWVGVRDRRCRSARRRGWGRGIGSLCWETADPPQVYRRFRTPCKGRSVDMDQYI